MVRDRSVSPRDKDRRRSRSPDRRRHRSPDRRRSPPDRRRSRSPVNRRRSRSPVERRRSRSRSPLERRRSRSPGERRDRDRDRKRSRSPKRSHKRDRHDKPKEEAKIDLEAVASTAEEDLMKSLGFAGFDSTKNKKVDGNVDGMAKINKPRKYRQYMNRKGGFNRPLDYVA